MIWIQWLWGNIRWEGCSAPWDKTPGLCHACGEQHLCTVHQRLIQCPTWNMAFLQLWTTTWAMWSGLAQHWLTGAPDEDKDSIARLRIPTSFVQSIPRKLRGELRERVAWHQYHMLLGVTILRSTLPMPPRMDSTPTLTTSASAWYGAIRYRKVTPNPTPYTLMTQVHYKAAAGAPPIPHSTARHTTLSKLASRCLAPTAVTRRQAIDALGTLDPRLPDNSTMQEQLTALASHPWAGAKGLDVQRGCSYTHPPAASTDHAVLMHPWDRHLDADLVSRHALCTEFIMTLDLIIAAAANEQAVRRTYWGVYDDMLQLTCTSFQGTKNLWRTLRTWIDGAMIEMAQRVTWEERSRRHKAHLMSTAIRGNYRHVRHEWPRERNHTDSELLCQHYDQLVQALNEARSALGRLQWGYDYHEGAVHLTVPPKKRHKAD